jgi:hypothetical protein
MRPRRGAGLRSTAWGPHSATSRSPGWRARRRSLTASRQMIRIGDSRPLLNIIVTTHLTKHRATRLCNNGTLRRNTELSIARQISFELDLAILEPWHSRLRDLVEDFAQRTPTPCQKCHLLNWNSTEFCPLSRAGPFPKRQCKKPPVGGPRLPQLLTCWNYGTPSTG